MVLDKRPFPRVLFSQKLWRISRDWMIHRWKTCSPFSAMAALSVIVLVVTAFYAFSLTVNVSPIYSAITNIEYHIGGNDRDNIDGDYIEKEFQKQWFRMQKARVDWKGMLVPCGYVNSVKNRTLIGWGQINATSRETSFVEYIDIRPAGQFSRIFIRTGTKDGRNKTIGGDFWMVIFSGPANVSATVFDHNNGSYEAIALLVDPGYYTIIAIIERSLCEGYREPEPSFYPRFMKLYYMSVSKYNEETPPMPARRIYVWGRINTAKIRFHVVQSQDNVQKRLRSVVRYQPCSTNCRFIWTGLGRWIGKDWKPYLKSDDHDLDLDQLKKEGRQPFESLYILGDSTNRMFAQEYFELKGLCVGKSIWNRCTWQMQSIFPLEKTPNPEAVKFSERYGNVSERFRFNVILDSIRVVFQTKEGMNSSRSLLILHYNTHQTKYFTFAQWKRLIQEEITLLKKRRQLFGSEAQVVWKTMTAIGYTGPFYQFEGMYHTAFRTRLFSAYALSEMCKAGIEIYDVYPMSASTLTGARDRVHFRNGVFPKAMEALTWWYLSNDKQKTQNVCLEP